MKIKKKKVSTASLLSFILLASMIGAYIIYFSVFTITRYKTLYASYFDLGIMHQTVHNTYQSIRTGDLSSFLELSNPHGVGHVKRMAVHNDILLAPIALLYFLYSGPETLLILQTVVLGLGAVFVYFLANLLIRSRLISLASSFAWLMYTPMQRANIFDFHAVTIATTTLLGMIYFWKTKHRRLAFLMFLLSLASKEQVAITTLFFGAYVFYIERKLSKFVLGIFFVSIVWFALSMLVIIPYFRGSEHFALEYYSNEGLTVVQKIYRHDTYRYFLYLLGPLGFLSFLSLPVLAIATPEFAINLLSNSWNMRNIIYHYTSVIQPFVFFSSIVSIAWISQKRFFKTQPRRSIFIIGITIYIIFFTLLFSCLKGPLPFSCEPERYPFTSPQKESADVYMWSRILKNDRLKISSTGQLSPFFTSRRYFYDFSEQYTQADYILIRLKEVYSYPEKKKLIPVYEKLIQDKRFTLIYKKNELEVFKKI